MQQPLDDQKIARCAVLHIPNLMFPVTQERVDTGRPRLLSDRLSWRHRARPSATLHETQACPPCEGANLITTYLTPFAAELQPGWCINENAPHAHPRAAPPAYIPQPAPPQIPRRAPASPVPGSCQPAPSSPRTIPSRPRTTRCPPPRRRFGHRYATWLLQSCLLDAPQAATARISPITPSAPKCCR